jgi:pyrroloquinoline quinone (PQQ) biosynthesis protein C
VKKSLADMVPPKPEPSGEVEAKDDGGDMAQAKLDAFERLARALGLDPKTLDSQEGAEALEEMIAVCSYEEG